MKKALEEQCSFPRDLGCRGLFWKETLELRGKVLNCVNWYLLVWELNFLEGQLSCLNLVGALIHLSEALTAIYNKF